jgi:hypothetical protein
VRDSGSEILKCSQGIGRKQIVRRKKLVHEMREKERQEFADLRKKGRRETFSDEYVVLNMMVLQDLHTSFPSSFVMIIVIKSSQV